jgi:hypothetical protein
LPGAIVNIGAVTVGCPCEDGAGSADQVWIVAQRADRSDGLLLSRIKNRWVIGPVQRWWLAYAAFERDSRASKLHYFEYAIANSRFVDSFPACAVPTTIQATSE